LSRSPIEGRTYSCSSFYPQCLTEQENAFLEGRKEGRQEGGKNRCREEGRKKGRRGRKENERKEVKGGERGFKLQNVLAVHLKDNCD
jgi:predicted transposase YdaD